MKRYSRYNNGITEPMQKDNRGMLEVHYKCKICLKKSVLWINPEEDTVVCPYCGCGVKREKFKRCRK